MSSWQMSSIVSRDLLDPDLPFSALPDAPVVPERPPRRVVRTRVATGLRTAAHWLDGRRGPVADPASAPC